MRIHLIAIGGSAMHNLAIALHKNGHKITGSDDFIFEPSLSRLKKHDLLPQQNGWNEDAISKDLDVVILGMHAKKNNPELIKAQQLNIPICSYPEYIFEQSKNKTRVVIGGSHGKTTITSMVMHALKHQSIDFDYLVGAQIEGFDTMVRLSQAPIILIEGDEYWASALQPYPKFHFYKAHIALISGIAWDHINVFPTFENYKIQFDKFIDTIEPNGTLFYASEDLEVKTLVQSHKFTTPIQSIAYQKPMAVIEKNKTFIIENGLKIPLQIFGSHNLTNMQAAKSICTKLGITENAFWESMKSFKGVSKRLEVWAQGKDFCIFRDFAHAPSKIKASISAVKQQYAERKLIACLELHTFSSLNKKFLSEYKNTTHECDIIIVYVNKNVLHQKGLEAFNEDEIKYFFGREDILFFEDKNTLLNYLKSIKLYNTNILLMSSGNFGGLELSEFHTLNLL